MAKLHELMYELIPPPPYSSDLAPSAYVSVPKNGSNDEVNAEMNANTEGL